MLQAITGIKAAAVVGEPDAQWGAVPVAYVISDQEITLAHQDQCSRKLAKYKRPKRIYFVILSRKQQVERLPNIVS